MQAVLIPAALFIAAVLVLLCVRSADLRRGGTLPPLPDTRGEAEDADIRAALDRMGPSGICPRCGRRVNPMERTCPHCGERLTVSRMKSFGGRSLHGEEELISEVNRWLYVNRSAVRIRADFSTAVRTGFPVGREVLSRVILSFEVAGVKRTEDYALVSPKLHSPFRVREGSQLLEGLLRRFPDARVVSSTGSREYSDGEDRIASFLRTQTVYALICLPRGSAKWSSVRKRDGVGIALRILAALLFLGVLAGIWLRVIGM